MGNASNLAQAVLLAIENDRQSFVSANVRKLLIEAAREGLGDPYTEQARKLIDEERSLQNAKWGRQDHDPQVWMAILGEEFGELCQAANDLRWPKDEPDADPFRHALVEAVQTAAVAQAIVECLLRSTWKWPRPQPAAAGGGEPAVDPDRVRAAAAEAGAGAFSQEDLDEFHEAVKRLVQLGVITIPKAGKGGPHG